MRIRQAGPLIGRPPQPIRQPGGYFDHEGNWRPYVAWSPPEPTAAERTRASMDGAGYDPEFVETVVAKIETGQHSMSTINIEDCTIGGFKPLNGSWTLRRNGLALDTTKIHDHETFMEALEPADAARYAAQLGISPPEPDYRPSRPIGVRVVICAVLVFVVLAGICAVVMGPMT